MSAHSSRPLKKRPEPQLTPTFFTQNLEIKNTNPLPVPAKTAPNHLDPGASTLFASKLRAI